MTEPTMMDHILAGPTWVMVWVFWMIAVNTASLVFVWKNVDARWVLAAWLANLVGMNLLFMQFGYVRLLGLSHVIFWTPLLIYLWRRRQHIPRSTASGLWLHVLFVTNFVSLLFDYTDVVRYVLGDS